jgi:hypothetical protein
MRHFEFKMTRPRTKPIFVYISWFIRTMRLCMCHLIYLQEEITWNWKYWFFTAFKSSSIVHSIGVCQTLIRVTPKMLERSQIIGLT